MLGVPLQLGPVRLATNLLLAPIAGYCDLAFRTICREASWIGPLPFPSVFSAPSVFKDGARELPARGFSALGLACTDLLSPQGLLRGTATSLDLAKSNDFDKPVGMQLYGSDPEIMAQGARWAVEHGATVVDINMGCPVDKVTKKDGGSKLLTDLSRALAIVARVVKELEKCPLSQEEWSTRLGSAHLGTSGTSPLHHSATPPLLSKDAPPLPSPTSSLRLSVSSSLPSSSLPVPLTCKLRLCWNTADYLAGNACSPDLARMLADAGVVGVTVHGRTTEDKFAGSVRLEGIARVVDAVNGRIPVIGNGDVREPGDAVRMLRQTGCNGVMIGRGALSTPWIFRDAWVAQLKAAPLGMSHLQMTHLRVGQLSGPGDYLPATEHPSHKDDPSDVAKIGLMRRYFDLMREHHDDRYAMFQMNRRVSWFAKRLVRTEYVDGRPRRLSVKPFKEAVRLAKTPDDVYEALNRFLAGELRGAEEAESNEAQQ